MAAGNSSNAGGYLTASKLGDGEHFRVSIVSESPLEYWTVWGESDDGQKKPFRFPQEPTPADITQELGDFKQRMNYEGTELEKPKFGLSFFVYDHADAKIKIFEITQKTLIGALDKLSQDEDYADIHAHDLKFGRKGLKIATEDSLVPSPRKEGMQAKIDAAWSEAQDKGYDLMKLMNGENPFGA